jgi:hypothetical protein
MPLYTNFNTFYLDSENISVRQGKSRIPGIAEEQNEQSVTVSTGYTYPSTTEAVGIRESRIRAAAGALSTLFIAVRTFQTPDGNAFDLATITKTISFYPASDSRQTGSFTTKQSIDVTGTLAFRSRCSLTAPQSFSGTLNVTASTTLSNNKWLWMLIMPIGSSSGGESHNVSNTASLTRAITQSSLVIASAYKTPLDGTNIPEANWAIYHKT